jgi:ATP-dependent DNA helicase Q1
MLTSTLQYFASSALLSSEKGDKGPEDLDSPCGHCDNCCRSSDQKETLDMTRAVWKALKVAEAVSRAGGRVTLSGLADVVRGLAGGTFPVVQPSKAQSSETRGAVDLEALCGGKLILSKEVRLTLPAKSAMQPETCLKPKL